MSIVCNLVLVVWDFTPMLHIKNISKSFGGTRVLQHVSFDVPVGNITALIGPNGAGKTTLFDVMTGVVRQDQGNIALNNIDISKKEAYERARLGISRTFQQVKLCENLTILDHFEMVKDNEDEKLIKNVFNMSLRASRSERGNLQISAFAVNASDSVTPLAPLKLRGEHESKIASQSLAMTEQYSTFLKSFNFDKPLSTRVLDLSYGQRKLLDLGLALFRKHTILLLDEPVAGVNQVVRKTIHKLLQDLKTKQETVLLIEHDIEFVRSIADTVIVLDEGKILTVGSPSEVFSNKQVMEAYLGE